MSVHSERFVDLDPRPGHQWKVDPWSIEVIGVFVNNGAEIQDTRGASIFVPTTYAPMVQVNGKLHVWTELQTDAESEAQMDASWMLAQIEDYDPKPEPPAKVPPAENLTSSIPTGRVIERGPRKP